MKKILMVMMLAAVGVFSLSANENENTLSVGLSAGYESEYTFRGVTKAEEVAITQVTVQLANAYFGVTGFFDQDDIENFDSEVDLVAGISTGQFLGAALDFGVTAYTYPNASTSIGETDYSIEPYIGLIFDDLLLTPGAYAYYDINKEALTLEVSVSETLTSENGLPLLGEVSFTPIVSVGYTDINDVTPNGVNTEDAYLYVTAKLNASFDVLGGTVAVGPRYSWTDGAEVDFNELTLGGSVSYDF